MRVRTVALPVIVAGAVALGAVMPGAAPLGAGAPAQVLSRPTEPPTISARGQAWYEQRVPIEFDGETYLRGGPVVFFNRDSMVRTGYFRGIPVFVNTTLEPHSVVFVPIGGGLLQPYEHPRTGSLAGTTGSRAPSFPVDILPDDGNAIAQAPTSPTSLPQPRDALDALARASSSGESGPRRSRPDGLGAVGTSGVSEAQPAPIHRAAPVHLETAIPPRDDDGIWIEYEGTKWIQSGRAVMIRESGLGRVGDYSGFPVFAHPGQADHVIYLPTIDGMAAPYRRSD